MPELSIYNFEDDDMQGDVMEESKLFDFLRENAKPQTVSRIDRDCITVYLAGPIEAELNQQAPHSIAWREHVKAILAMDEEVVWDVRDPNNGKADGVNYIKHEGNEHYYNPYILFRTDIQNVSESDFVIANLSKFVKGFGTPFEMGYAFCKGIPIICICEPGVKPEHPFITESVDAIVYSEEEAINVIKYMLTEE